MELKKWVRSAREHKGLTQTELGDKLHVTKGNVSAWENGHHEPSFGQLQVIAEVTGYPLLPHDVHTLKKAEAQPPAPKTTIPVTPEEYPVVLAFVEGLRTSPPPRKRRRLAQPTVTGGVRAPRQSKKRSAA